MEWHEVIEQARDWADRVVDRVPSIKRAVAIPTVGDVGVYWHAVNNAIGLFAPDGVASDRVHVHRGLSKAGHAAIDIPAADLVDQPWMKIAFSLRTAGIKDNLQMAGKATGFFPVQTPLGTLKPTPLTAMLGSMLVGGGLGYLGGTAASKLVPEEYEHLGRALPILGLAAGAGPGMLGAGALGLSNYASGRSLNETSPFQTLEGPAKLAGAELPNFPKEATEVPELPPHLRSRLKVGFSAGSSPEYAPKRSASPLDVNINALGQTLWDTGASPGLAGATMGVVYAANQMPGDSRAGTVSPSQFGHLALAAGKSYLVGAAVGATLGWVSNLDPAERKRLARTGGALSVIGTVVPKLFGGD